MRAETLTRAFDRVERFVEVQRAAGAEISPEAVLLLQEAVGLDEMSRATICHRLEALETVGISAERAAVLLGIVIGLFAAET